MICEKQATLSTTPMDCGKCGLRNGWIEKKHEIKTFSREYLGN
jgi:hypothetical protein